MNNDNVVIETCAQNIEDTIICDLMKYCTKRYKIVENNGIPQCSELSFSFIFPYKDELVHMTVQREKNRLIYSGILSSKKVSETDVKRLIRYLDGIGGTDRWIPGARLDEEEDDLYYIVSRCDIPLDDTSPSVNQSNLIDSLLNFKRFLNEMNQKDLDIF